MHSRNHCSWFSHRSLQLVVLHSLAWLGGWLSTHVYAPLLTSARRPVFSGVAGRMVEHACLRRSSPQLVAPHSTAWLDG